MTDRDVRDPAEVTAERLHARRQKLLDVLREVYGYIPPEVAFAVSECVQASERIGEHHVGLRNTFRKEAPDGDRAPVRAAPDRLPPEEDRTPVQHPRGRRR